METDEKPPISSQYFLSQARELVDEAAARGIVLRILGAVAVRIHSSEYAALHQSLARVGGETEFTDLDLIGYGKDRDELEPFFKSTGFEPERRARRSAPIWAHRQIYIEPKGRFHVDVFLDVLEMSHTLDFRQCLELDYPTISLPHLLLEKMQIQRINEKDIKDVIVLLRAHRLDASDKESINEDYIAKSLKDDWGFYYTVTSNLAKTKLLLMDYRIPQADRDDVLSKIDRLVSRIEAEPKSLAFKLRAKVGTKRKWYNDVDEVFG